MFYIQSKELDIELKDFRIVFMLLAIFIIKFRHIQQILTYVTIYFMLYAVLLNFVFIFLFKNIAWKRSKRETLLECVFSCLNFFYDTHFTPNVIFHLTYTKLIIKTRLLFQVQAFYSSKSLDWLHCLVQTSAKFKWTSPTFLVFLRSIVLTKFTHDFFVF